MRSVFLDASVLFAAGYSRTGSAYDLAMAGGAGRVQLFASRYVLDEVRRNLAAKFPEGLGLVDELVESSVLRMANPPATDVDRVALVVERKDAPVIAAAMAAGAPVVATYDRRHLLSQADVILAAFGVEVLTPEDVLRRLAAADDEVPTS